MAASALTVQNLANTGVTPSFGAANADGNYFTNNGKSFLVLKNGSGGSIVATVASQVLCNQGSTHNIEVTVSAGSEEWIGPLDNNRFNDADGYVQVTYDGVTDLTAAAISL